VHDKKRKNLLLFLKKKKQKNFNIKKIVPVTGTIFFVKIFEGGLGETF